MTNTPGVADHAAETVDTEPVINAAKLGGLTAAAVTAVGGVIVLIIGGRAGDLSSLGLAVGAAVTAVASLVSYIAPVVHARKARTQVTPLARPRDCDGTPLVRAA